MADLAAHWLDHMLPDVPIRQWVLTLPWPLRYRLAWDPALLAEVLALGVRPSREARLHLAVVLPLEDLA